MSETAFRFTAKIYKKSTSIKLRARSKLMPVILMVFLIVACQATPSASDQLDYILRSNDDCAAPCWQMMIPGQSTQEEFLDLVEMSPSKQFAEMNQGALQVEGVVYSWDDDVYESFNQIRIYEERIRLIGFQPKSRSITLAMLQNILGSPTAYGASQLGVEKVYIQMILIYEVDGTVIEIWIPATERDINIAKSNCEFEIDWEVPLEKVWIYFVAPNSAEEMVQYGPIGGFNNPNHKPQVWVDENPIKLTQCP